MKPLVSVIITTCNRASELQAALESVRRQSYRPMEIIVMDDASNDDTTELIKSRFAEVRLIRNSTPVGLILARNRLMREARGDYIFSLDDDSYFMSEDAISSAVNTFQSFTDIGALSFRIICPANESVCQQPDSLPARYLVAAYVGCGHALRRDLLSRVGLYPTCFTRYGEEENDLSLRIMDAGYWVVRLRDVVVRHEYSFQNRDEAMTTYWGMQNGISIVLMRYPWYLVAPFCVQKLASYLLFTLRKGWVRTYFAALLSLAKRLPGILSERRPVSLRAIKTWLVLRRAHTIKSPYPRRA